MTPQLVRELDAIRADRENGAAVLTRCAAQAFASVLVVDDVLEGARRLAAAQPSMAPLQKLAEELVAAPERAGQICRETLWRLETAPARIAARAAECIPPGAVVLTNSFSSTVLAVLRAIAPERVYVAESRPGGEGAALASELGEVAAVVADAEVFRFAQRASYIVVGADAVTPGGVINKVGTALIALAAKTLDRPAYVCCDSGKVIGRVLPVEAPFELTPLDWFTAVLTEEAVLDAAQAIPLSR